MLYWPSCQRMCRYVVWASLGHSENCCRFVPRVVEAANTIMIVRGVPLLITIIVVVGSSLLHRAYDIARYQWTLSVDSRFLI